jgi:hypothetical protein
MNRPFSALLLGVAAAACAPGCTCQDLSTASGPAAAPITAPFSDGFDRAALGPDWIATDPQAYRIEGGELIARAAYNHPLWLARPLPRDATIEFDCWSNDDAGDLKVEIWGDGRSYATDRVGAYTSTSYNFIFGGWHNQISTLARMHEHGEDRQVRRDVRVVKGRHYHWTIRRKGAHVEWLIDNQPFLSFDDPAPLDGPDHRFFAINDWEAELHFDNLRITP